MSSHTNTIIPSPTDTKALANRINFQTRDAHNKINKKMSIKLAIALRHGFIYRQGILTYYYIFKVVEEEIIKLTTSPTTSEEVKIGNLLSKTWIPEFNRTENLLKDLQLLYHDEYPTKEALQLFLETNATELPPVLDSFIKYIHQSILENPCSIFAYCHVLYLALFAGGKIIRSKIYKNLGFLPNFNHLSSKEVFEKGTNFFKFGSDGVIEETKLKLEFKKNYELNTRES